LIPLTIKQVLQSKGSDDTFRVDGSELNTIKLVGNMYEPQDHTTNFTFKLDDGSGIIECKQWLDKDNGIPSALKNVMPGSSVRVFGNVREYEGRIHILVFHAAEITDMNEISYHVLDVIYTHLQNSRGPIAVRVRVLCWWIIIFDCFIF
jgi:replication factor A2